MIAAFSTGDQLRRRPAPVNTSMRRTGSGICLCSEIDCVGAPIGSDNHPSGARPKGGAQTPLTLDAAFAAAQVQSETLQRQLADIARLQGELRYTHLRYHLAMRDLLRPDQIAAYDRLRGYKNPPGALPGTHEHRH